MKNASKEDAQQIAVQFVRKRKNPETIDVFSVDQEDGVWIINGECPIDLEGNPWTERFEVIIDQKGKIKSADFSLM
jgi:hypothetical protein